MTNMFNFMDGLDGLAGGSGLVAAVFLAVVAPPGSPIQIGALALAAGLAGFLPFNLAPARIFMGDAGSLFCGFFLGFLGLSLADGSAGSTLLLVPMLMGGMVFDVVLTLIRRLGAGARLTQGHREHLYQRKALADGWVAALHWGFVLCGGLAWLMLEQGGYGAAICLLVVPQLVWWGFVVRRGPMWIG